MVIRVTGYFTFFIFFLFFLFGVLNLPAKAQKQRVTAPDLTQLEKMTARFAPTPLRGDTSKLSSGDRQALSKLIEARRVIDDIFLQQYWSGNPALYAHLQKDATPLGKARLHYFRMNKGPWSALDEFKAFLPGVPPRKLPGANFYAEDMTKQDFERWFASLPPKEQEAAKSFFTVIRWKKDGGSSHRELMSVPYSEEYKDALTQAANL